MGEVVNLGEYKARKLGFPDHIAVGTYTDAKGNKCVRLEPKEGSNGKSLKATQYAARRKEDKTFNYVQGDKEQQLMAIQDLLQQATDIMSYMPQLRSVSAREQAVLDSMKFRERADELAKQNGWIIRKGEDNQYIISPKD